MQPTTSFTQSHYLWYFFDKGYVPWHVARGVWQALGPQDGAQIMPDVVDCRFGQPGEQPKNTHEAPSQHRADHHMRVVCVVVSLPEISYKIDNIAYQQPQLQRGNDVHGTAASRSMQQHPSPIGWIRRKPPALRPSSAPPRRAITLPTVVLALCILLFTGSSTYLVFIARSSIEQTHHTHRRSLVRSRDDEAIDSAYRMASGQAKFAADQRRQGAHTEHAHLSLTHTERPPVLVSYAYFQKDAIQKANAEFFSIMVGLMWNCTCRRPTPADKQGMGLDSSFPAPSNTEFVMVRGTHAHMQPSPGTSIPR